MHYDHVMIASSFYDCHQSLTLDIFQPRELSALYPLLKMKTKTILGSAIVLFLFASTGSAADLQTTRNTLDNWVQTKQLISKEKNDWLLEETILNDTRDLLSNEISRLKEAISELESTASAADEERAQLTDQKSDLSAGSEVIEGSLAKLEVQLQKIIQTLPQPLLDKIKPLVRRLPDDPENTDLSIGERVQNIVGILSQADKFNTTLTITSESREMEAGKFVQVSTLYWGLAMAYYVDDSGDYAGIGLAGANGWTWPEIDGAGSSIKKLFEIYEGTADIQFVDVPAQIN